VSIPHDPPILAHTHPTPDTPEISPAVAVAPDPSTDDRLTQTARRLAQNLSLPFLYRPADKTQIVLAVTPQRIELRPATPRNAKPVFCDFSRLDTHSPSGRTRRQPLAKAISSRGKRDHPLHVLDATAGLGEDTWLLACLGYRVTAIERSPVVATLLQNGLDRAMRIDPCTAQRITLLTTDARHWLAHLDPDSPAPDVIYLDPMYPPKRKTALSRLPIRLIRQLVGHDLDAGELFELAIQTAARRVVVKRPMHAPPIANQPAVSHKGKSIRYDVYPTTTS